MSVSHKSSNTQTHRLITYRRALHPELFDLQGRRIHRQPEYEVEQWLLKSGHVVRFQAAGHCISETVIEKGDHLPEHGLIHAMPCMGEKDYEFDDEEAKIGYVTTIQTEMLTENLYQATLREMIDFAEETGALMKQWTDSNDNACLSVLDAQRYSREFHLQSYHLIGSAGQVLRTQSIFEKR